jgi:hypothetical protein
MILCSQLLQIEINANEVKILLKVKNEIITNIDIQNEMGYLSALNNEVLTLDKNTLYQLAKNSVIKERIKKNELVKYYDISKILEEYDDIFENFYKKMGYENDDEIQNYLNNYNLKTKEIKIDPLMNGEDLINIISVESCSLLYEVLKNYFKGEIFLTDQDASKASYAHKISKDECQINWSETNHIINQKIKAFYPYPAMWFSFEGKRYKILKAKITEKTGKIGVIIDNELTIACGQGSIQIDEIQVEGKSKMNSKDFILGYKNFQIGKNINA